MIGSLRSAEHMACVLATRRAGTPLGAARQLTLAPSTVYRAIDRLERDIGMPLFERGPAGWVPTEIGERVVRLAEATEAEIAEVERYLLGEVARFPTPVRVSASDGLAEGYLGPVLAQHAQRNEGITIDLVVDNRFVNLARNEAHIAIRPHQKPGEGLVGRRGAKLAHALYGARALFRKQGLPKSVADLSRFRICVLSEKLEYHTAATWWTTGLRSRANVSLIANTEMSLAAAVAAGAGVGVLPCFLGDRLKGVQRVRTIPVGPPVDVWLVTDAALRKNPVVLGLIRALAEAMRRDAPRLAGTRS